MSKNLASVIFERAVQLWTPDRRCYGKEKMNRLLNGTIVFPSKFCAVGVLKQARKDVGISGRLYSINKLAKMLGYVDADHLMRENDGGRYYQKNQQSKIYEAMKKAAKGELFSC